MILWISVTLIRVYAITLSLALFTSIYCLHAAWPGHLGGLDYDQKSMYICLLIFLSLLKTRILDQQRAPWSVGTTIVIYFHQGLLIQFHHNFCFTQNLPLSRLCLRKEKTMSCEQSGSQSLVQLSRGGRADGWRLAELLSQIILYESVFDFCTSHITSSWPT